MGCLKNFGFIKCEAESTLKYAMTCQIISIDKSDLLNQKHPFIKPVAVPKTA